MTGGIEYIYSVRTPQLPFPVLSSLSYLAETEFYNHPAGCQNTAPTFHNHTEPYKYNPSDPIETSYLNILLCLALFLICLKLLLLLGRLFL